MDKAYDLKALGEMVLAKGKEKGLAIADEAVRELATAVYEGMKDWLTQSAAMSANKVDDFVTAFLPELDSIVLPQIAKIDLDGDGA